MLAAFEFIRRRPSRTPFGTAAAILLLAASGAAPADGAQAPKVHSPPPSPARTGDAEPPLVSTSAMDETDHARCVSELASKKVVFEQPKEATRECCRLSPGQPANRKSAARAPRPRQRRSSGSWARPCFRPGQF